MKPRPIRFRAVRPVAPATSLFAVAPLLLAACLLMQGRAGAGPLEEEAARQLTFCWDEAQKGSYERAKQSAESALRLDPSLFEAMVCKAQAYEGLGNRELAEAILNAYLELHGREKLSPAARALMKRLGVPGGEDPSDVAAADAAAVGGASDPFVDTPPAKAEEEPAELGEVAEKTEKSKTSAKDDKGEKTEKEEKAEESEKAEKPEKSTKSEESSASSSGPTKEQTKAAAEKQGKASAEAEIAAEAEAGPSPEQQKRRRSGGIVAGVLLSAAGLGAGATGLVLVVDSVQAQQHLDVQRSQAAAQNIATDDIEALESKERQYLTRRAIVAAADRKSTRLNSSHT